MEYLVYYEKLKMALDKEIEEIQNQNQEEDQLTQAYNDIKEKNHLTFLEHEDDYIIHLLVQEGLELNEVENIVKASKFLLATKNQLDESMKDIFEHTEQYITTMNTMNQIFTSLKDNIVARYENKKSKTQQEQMNKLSTLNELKQKVADNENLQIIDEEKEVELLFEVLSKTDLKESEKISFAKGLFLSNIKNYNKKNTHEEEQEQNIETTKNLYTIDSLQEVNFQTLTEEDKFNLSLLENIMNKNREKYDAIPEEQKQYLETVISINSHWINDPSYKHYKENLFLHYFKKTYDSLFKEAKEIMNMSVEEKEDYAQVFHEDIQEVKNVLNEYEKIHSEYKNNIEKKQEKEILDTKQHLLFLTNDNNIPYITNDMENMDKKVMMDTIKTLEKLRLGQNNGKNTNYSNQFYATDKVLLYRDFCSSGVIEVAYIPMGMEDIFVIGACNNGRDNLNDTKKIDKVIGNRLQSKNYFEQLNINKTLLQSDLTKENIRKEHKTYFMTLKENPRIK